MQKGVYAASGIAEEFFFNPASRPQHSRPGVTFQRPGKNKNSFEDRAPTSATLESAALARARGKKATVISHFAPYCFLQTSKLSGFFFLVPFLFLFGFSLRTRSSNLWTGRRSFGALTLPDHSERGSPKRFLHRLRLPTKAFHKSVDLLVALFQYCRRSFRKCLAIDEVHASLHLVFGGI